MTNVNPFFCFSEGLEILSVNIVTVTKVNIKDGIRNTYHSWPDSRLGFYTSAENWRKQLWLKPVTGSKTFTWQTAHISFSVLKSHMKTCKKLDACDTLVVKLFVQYSSVPTAGFAENVLVITEKYGCEFSCSGCLCSKNKTKQTNCGWT